MKKKTRKAVRVEDGKYSYITASTTYNGKQVKGYGGTYAEAVRCRNKKVAELEAQAAEANVDSPSGNTLFPEYADNWFEQFVKPKIRNPADGKLEDTIASKSAAMYEQAIRLHLREPLNDKKMSEITKMNLQTVINEEVTKHDLSKRSAEKIILTASCIFGQAYEDGIIKKNPAKNLVLSGTPPKERRPLTDEECRLIDNYDGSNRDADMFRFVLHSGIRDEEIVSLRVRHIDLDAMVVHVSDAVQSGTARTIADTKSQNGQRDIPISDDLLDVIIRVTKGKNKDELLFCNKAGNILTVREFIRRWHVYWREIDIAQGAEMTPHKHIYDPRDVDKYGMPLYPDAHGRPRNGHKVDPTLTPYNLRHTFSTQMARAGVPDEIRRYIMGHDDITTTKGYTHIAGSDAADARKLLNKYSTDKNSDKT